MQLDVVRGFSLVLHDPEGTHYVKEGGMSEARICIVAQSREKSYAKLVCKPRITPEELEREGAKFGQWLLENGSTSFLKGLHHLFDEAEITKKIGLGY